MSKERQSAAAALAPPLSERRPRIALGFELRATPPGEVRHAASSDHHIGVLVGAAARFSCRASPARAVYTRGDICLVPAGMDDAWVEHDGSRSIDIRLPPSLLRGVAAELGLNPDNAGVEPRYHFRDPQIEHIAWALAAESRIALPHGLLYRQSLGMALASHLLARYRAPTPVRGGLSPPRLQRVTDYIEDHLGQTLSLDELARVAGLSASHFKTLFKQSLGVPVHAYVVQRRVERAKALLQRGQRSLSEVALEAGFAHQSHMARCMRRVLGVTPNAIARSRR